MTPAGGHPKIRNHRTPALATVSARTHPPRQDRNTSKVTQGHAAVERVEFDRLTELAGIIHENALRTGGHAQVPAIGNDTRHT